MKKRLLTMIFSVAFVGILFTSDAKKAMAKEESLIMGEEVENIGIHKVETSGAIYHCVSCVDEAVITMQENFIRQTYV